MSSYQDDVKAMRFQRHGQIRYVAEFWTMADALKAIETIYRKFGTKAFLSGPITLDYVGGGSGFKVRFALPTHYFANDVHLAKRPDVSDPELPLWKDSEE